MLRIYGLERERERERERVILVSLKLKNDNSTLGVLLIVCQAFVQLHLPKRTGIRLPMNITRRCETHANKRRWIATARFRSFLEAPSYAFTKLKFAWGHRNSPARAG
jgi:hypothetical protein